jgi:type II secretory pathway pseudopilin PulG
MINRKLTSDKKGTQGFTLVELLLYIGIFSMLIIMMFQLLATIFNTQLESTSTSSIDQDRIYLMSKFSYDLGRATSVLMPASYGQTTTSLQLNIGGVTYSYALSGNDLVLTNASTGVAAHLNSAGSTISNISFTKLGDINGKQNDTVTITFTIVSKDLVNGVSKSQVFRLTSGIRKP